MNYAAKVSERFHGDKAHLAGVSNDDDRMKTIPSEPARKLQEMRERVKHTPGFPDLSREQMAKEIGKNKSWYVHYEAVFKQPTMRPDLVELFMAPLIKRGVGREEIIRNLIGGVGTSANLSPNAGIRVPVLDVAGVLRLVRGDVGLGSFARWRSTEAALEQWEKSGIVLGWERVPSAPETSFLIKVWDDRMDRVAPRGSQILVDFAVRQLEDSGRYLLVVDDELVFGTYRAGPDRIIFEGNTGLPEISLAFSWPVVVGRVRKRIVVTDL